MKRLPLILSGLFVLLSGCGKQQPKNLPQERSSNPSQWQSAAQTKLRVPIIVSKERAYVEPLEPAILDQIKENIEFAKTSINIPQSPIFWTNTERVAFYTDELRLFGEELKFTLENYFPVSLWNKLDEPRRQAFARVQVRWQSVQVTVNDGTKTVPIEGLLPKHIQLAINKVPVEVPEVEVVSIFDLYRELVPEMASSLPPEARSNFQYPQCFSAVLWFYGIQKRPRIFANREVLLGQKNIRVALAEVFGKNGFERITKVKEQSDLQFGDILMFPPHSQVYLSDDLVFEKPNGDAYSPWRIMESDVTRTVKKDPELVVMRKKAE